MVYFVTRPKSREHKLTLEEVLFGLVDDKRLSEVSAPQNKINVNTRTDCVNKIPDKVLKAMQKKIAADIDAMVAFYNRNKELDIFFDSRYNYARQCEIKKQVKNKLILSGEYDEELIIAETRNRMENEGLMYNPYYYTFFIPKHSSEPGHMKFRQIDAPEPQLKNALTELKKMNTKAKAKNNSSGKNNNQGPVVGNLVEDISKNVAANLAKKQDVTTVVAKSSSRLPQQSVIPPTVNTKSEKPQQPARSISVPMPKPARQHMHSHSGPNHKCLFCIPDGSDRCKFCKFREDELGEEHKSGYSRDLL